MVWLNEKAAPEGLGFKRELVERLQEEVHSREDFLENNDSGTEQHPEAAAGWTSTA